MRSAIFSAFLAVFLGGCSTSDGSKTEADLLRRVASLEVEVASLKTQLGQHKDRLDLDREMISKLGHSVSVALESKSPPSKSWIAWEDRQLLGDGARFVGPSPRKAIGAFLTLPECTDALRANAAANKGDPDTGTYRLRTSSGALEIVSMTCLPEGVAPQVK